jgi:hypothetical protein
MLIVVKLVSMVTGDDKVSHVCCHLFAGHDRRGLAMSTMSKSDGMSDISFTKCTDDKPLKKKQAIQLINSAPLVQVVIGMDVAASEFYKPDGTYDLNFKEENNDGSFKKSVDEMIELYTGFIKDFPVVTIEDPFDQDDWSAWAKIVASAGVQIVGDDLTVTNPKKIKEAIEKKAANALLLKVGSYSWGRFRLFPFCSFEDLEML